MSPAQGEGRGARRPDARRTDGPPRDPGGPRRQGGARSPRPARGRDGAPGSPRSAGGRPEPGRSARAARPAGRREEPTVPEGITGRELDRAVRAQLTGLSAVNADVVAKHLVAAGRLLEDDAEAAYAHAVAARGRAGRVAAVREAAGIAAYVTQRWAEALSELRAARRMSGSDEHLPLMADCERGLGRPEKALELAGSPPASSLDRAGRVELRIVAAGARRDLGQLDAAILTLAVPELQSAAREPWSARLRYAYADALLAAGRCDEATNWFARAAAVDEEGTTGAGDRLAELQGVVFLDPVEEDGEASTPPDDGAAGGRAGAGPASGQPQ